MKLEIHPASAERFADLAAVLRPKNDSSHACWCLTYRLSNTENSALVGDARPVRLHKLCERSYAPGVLAYIDGIPAGWCAVGPREDFERLNRSKTIQVLDATPVWSIVCLLVRAEFRRKGVAGALIRGASDYAASQGAQAVEAYPIESEGARVSSSLAFTGTTAMFAAAGFTFCAVTKAQSAGKPRVIMRCHLQNMVPGTR
jgi:GNAT superfamily N-acetyltransferase